MRTVSIILPTYRDAPFLPRAVASVFNQDFSDWELIIIDDGLTPQARDSIQQDPRIVYIKNEENIGIQRSLNRGLAAATGKYIARIDDDDVWIDSDKLSKQIAFLEQHEEYVLVGTNATIIDERDTVLVHYHLPETDHVIRQRMLSKNCFLHPTILARTDAVVRAGGYDESLATQHIEDYDLWLKLGTAGKFANLADSTTVLMVHEGSLTFQNRVVQARHVRSLIARYKHTYPRFVWSYVLLSIRVIGFSFLQIVPLPKRLLYWIQKVYKEY